VFCLKGVLLFDGIGGYTDHGDAGFGEIGVEAGKILGLDGATGGVGLGVEVQDQLPAFEIGKRHRAPAITREAKIGSRGAFGKGLGHMPSFRRFPTVWLGFHALAGGSAMGFSAFSGCSHHRGDSP
jgi:hypothetical protein